jgi:hypothetical protein
MDQNNPGGNIGLREQDYYPWDCQGYSQSTGLVSEIKIKEGWNLVPTGISLRDCYYALEGELCKDDVLVSYIYIPTLNKYLTHEEIEKKQEDPQIKTYFSEENEFTVQKSSEWIYVKPGSGNKKVIGTFGAYIPYRNEYLKNGAFKLKNGWNFLFVDAFMVYDDNWKESPLSLNDIKGNCNILDSYVWLNDQQKWYKDSKYLDADFGKEWIGNGMIVKVSNNCNLGSSSSNSINPPQIPGDNIPPTDSGDSDKPSLPNQIGPYFLVEASNEGPNASPECNQFGDHPDTAWTNLTGEVCIRGWRINYLDNQTNKGIFVIISQITKGKDIYEKYFDLVAKPVSISGSNVMRLEGHELFWFTSGDYDLIMTQEYTQVPSENGVSYSYGTATGDNEITRYLLNKYPSEL